MCTRTGIINATTTCCLGAGATGSAKTYSLVWFGEELLCERCGLTIPVTGLTEQAVPEGKNRNLGKRREKTGKTLCLCSIKVSTTESPISPIVETAFKYFPPVKQCQTVDDQNTTRLQVLPNPLFQIH